MNEELKNDLNYFLECANKFHINFYHTHSREELNEYITNYLNYNYVDNKYQLMYMMKNIIKYMSADKDGHTTVYFDDNRSLPLDFIYIDNSLFIASAFDKSFVKAKVLKINNVPVNQLIQELEPIVSYANKEWFERNIEIELTRIQTLAILPSLNYDTDIFEIETDKGLLTIDIHTNYSKEEEDKYNIINNTLLFKYKVCDESNMPNISEIDRIIKENNIKCIAIDMRNNAGGNEKILKPLVDYLKNIDTNIDVVVNKGVFSAARWNVLDLVNIGANVIGEKIGTPINCFGSRNYAGKTPNCGINMVFSKWYIFYNKDSNTIEFIDEKAKLKDKLLVSTYLELNNEIPLTKNDFLNDIDPVVEYYKKSFDKKI